MISYSQNGEDIILRRVLAHVRNGTYIDIGSGHTTVDSVTKIFYDEGWSGINIEPDDRLFPFYQTERNRDINLFSCISTLEGHVDFWQASTQGWSTTNSKIAEDISNIEIVSLQKRRGITLDYVLGLKDSPIHFLKIDCEGDELAILESSLFEMNRPWIIVVETVVPRKNESDFNRIEDVLRKRNYEAALFDGLNHYFVDNSMQELLHSNKWYPACVLDTYVTKNVNENFLQTQELHKTLENLIDKLVHVRQELEVSQSEITHVRQENDLFKTDLTNIMSSRIWRASLPYRRIRNFIANTRIRLVNAYHYNSSPIQFSKILAQYVARRIKSKILPRTYIYRSKREATKELSGHPAINQPTLINGSSFSGRAGSAALKILPKFNETLYVLVGATVDSGSNTGVQKVVKSISEELFLLNYCPVFVRVDLESRRIIKLNAIELKKFTENFSMNYKEIIEYSKLDQDDYLCDATLFVPEVPYNSSNDPLLCDVLTAYCNSYNLVPYAIYYDSIPLTTPGYEYGIEAHLGYLQFLTSCHLITCISESSASELNNLFSQYNFKILDTKPVVITQHLPIPKACLKGRAQEISSLIDHKFVLTVGTVEPRKNQITSISAFIELASEVDDLPALVIVGGIRPDVKNWQELSRNHNIVWLGNVTDEELVWLYQKCEFTIFISKSEGFGYPVLESAYFGKICITSSHGSMGEIAKKTPSIVMQNVEDVVELKNTVLAVLTNLDKRSLSLNVSNLKEESNWQTYVEELFLKVNQASLASMGNVKILYWVDHTSRYNGNSGIQRVVRGLASAILKGGVSLTPVVWDADSSNFQVANEEQRKHLSNWSGPEKSLWDLEFDLTVKSEVNQILIIPELTTYSPDDHFLSRILLKAKSIEMKTAVIFFDALPVLLPDVYPASTAIKHRAYMNDLHEADAILAISESARRDLIEHFLKNEKLDVSKITKMWTVHLPSLFVGQALPNSDLSEIGKSVEKKVSVFCVGTLEARKNYINLISAFEKVVQELPANSIELVIAGKGVDEKITRFVVEAAMRLPIRWVGQVSDEDLKEFYKSCDFSVFPSFGEGFGLPLTESLGFGKPVLCGTGGALGENTAEGGCFVVDVRSSNAMASGIIQLATNGELLNKLKKEIRERKFTTWDQYACNVLGVSLRIHRKH